MLPSTGATEERDDRQYQENHEKDLRYPGGGASDAAKAEYGGNDRNDQENQGVMKHEGILFDSKRHRGGEDRVFPFTHNPCHAGVKGGAATLHAAPTSAQPATAGFRL